MFFDILIDFKAMHEIIINLENHGVCSVTKKERKNFTKKVVCDSEPSTSTADTKKVINKKRMVRNVNLYEVYQMRKLLCTLLTFFITENRNSEI